jgi:DNA uptake protein ComE-like DNA-binding protein
LYEVWNLDPEVANEVLRYFKINSPPTIQKININTASFKEVLAIVYIDYELTKKIFEYRDEVAEIQSIEELKKIDGFPLDKFNRIALYLHAK